MIALFENPTQNILIRLHGVKKTTTGWSALCPAHSDQHASLSVSECWSGECLVHCHAGCTAESIVNALGLGLKDLFPQDNSKSDVDKLGDIVATYSYNDESGNLLYQVVRYEPKNFRQRRPDNDGGWIWNMDGVTKVLYNLPAIKKDIGGDK